MAASSFVLSESGAACPEGKLLKRIACRLPYRRRSYRSFFTGQTK
ncbi:hypothetical protein SS05631_b53260 (plasmid) [Sinorhizobium sp. CCBAU 05631]|nr:hypothetical protein SS05631_b53260 [Sinorhizobium sp. CCBAU 05631]